MIKAIAMICYAGMIMVQFHLIYLTTFITCTCCFDLLLIHAIMIYFTGKVVRSPYGVMHGKSSPVYYDEKGSHGLFSGLPK